MFKDYSILADCLTEKELQYYFNEFLSNNDKYENKIESLENLF